LARELAQQGFKGSGYAGIQRFRLCRSPLCGRLA
jgi:hypothetical protein